MTTENTAQPTSPEERFLGVRTTIKPAGKDNPDKVPLPEVVASDDDESVSDARNDTEELESYSEKVQKRIKHMTWEREEQRRRADAAEKMREEAVNFAKSALQKNQQYEALINQGEGYLLQNQKQAAEMAVAAAKAKYRQAYEEGDTDAIMRAQDEMLMEQAKWYEAHKAEVAYHQRSTQQHQQAQQWQAWQQMQRQRRPQQPQQVQVPKPTKKAQQWAEQNPWFGKAEHKDMTALAYGVHERLVREEGYDPDSDEYFNEIDREMRKRFSDYFERQGQAQTHSHARNTATVVAPAGRNNGAKPRQVKLTRTQLSLAKRLGITPEQYARQLIKESQHG